MNTGLPHKNALDTAVRRHRLPLPIEPILPAAKSVLTYRKHHQAVADPRQNCGVCGVLPPRPVRRLIERN